MSLIEKALAIALQAYAGKKDQVGQAYILHPLRLMAEVEDETSMAVALLHNVIEDSDITAKDLLAAGLPQSVVGPVESLARCEGESYEAFIERVCLDPVACRVKLVDIADNLNVLRLPTLSEADLHQVEKYHRAWHRLKSACS